MNTVNNNGMSIDVILLDVQKQSEASTSRDVDDAKSAVAFQQGEAAKLREDIEALELKVESTNDEIEDISQEPEPFILLALLGMDDREHRTKKAAATADVALGEIEVVDAHLAQSRERMGRAIEGMQDAIERFDGGAEQLRSTLETTAALQDQMMR